MAITSQADRTRDTILAQAEAEARRIRGNAEAESIRGYCAAVRSALTDDVRAPLEAPGLKLAGRLEEVAASLDRVEGKRGSRRN